jgi:hypothetical protein
MGKKYKFYKIRITVLSLLFSVIFLIGSTATGMGSEINNFNSTDSSSVAYNKTSSTTDTIYYVSTTGKDSNNGLTSSTAFATFQHAIDLGASIIYGERGKYYNQSIVQNKISNKLQIMPYENNDYDDNVTERPLIEIINASKLESLKTDSDGLLTQIFEGNDRFRKVFIDKTLNTETDDSRASYNAGLWQVYDDIADDIKLKPVLTKKECIGEAGSFYWDGTYIYINPSNGNDVDFWVQNDTNYGINLQNIQNLVLQDISVKFSYSDNYLILNCMNAKLQNCSSYYTMFLNGFRLDNSNINLYNCSAFKARNDGFNIHHYGESNFYNCEGGYNYDDGISHHDGANGTIIGGEWYNNGKGGIAPAYSSVVDVYNAICHDNVYGFYCVASSDEPYRTVMHVNNVCYDNDYGILVKYYKILSYNCKYNDNTVPKQVTNGELDQL